MENSPKSKKCTKCKHFLLFENFKTNQRTGQLTKTCKKCLDRGKILEDKAKCPHRRRKSRCCECGGDSLCPHNLQKNHCKRCGGSNICHHERIKRQCRDCLGSRFCMHKKLRPYCKACGGSQICAHNKQRQTCSICDPAGHLAGIVRSRVYHALQKDKEMSSQEYLGCDIDTFKQHIESQFVEGMTWGNFGSEWHIDHKIPLKYQQDGIPPTLEEVSKRLYYLNTQPMWASENISKGNRFISE